MKVLLKLELKVAQRKLLLDSKWEFKILDLSLQARVIKLGDNTMRA